MPNRAPWLQGNIFGSPFRFGPILPMTDEATADANEQYQQQRGDLARRKQFAAPPTARVIPPAANDRERALDDYLKGSVLTRERGELARRQQFAAPMVPPSGSPSEVPGIPGIPGADSPWTSLTLHDPWELLKGTASRPAPPVGNTDTSNSVQSSPRSFDKIDPNDLPTVDLPNQMDTVPYKIGVDDITLHPTKPVDPLQAKYEELTKFFGTQDYSNPKQDKADQYAQDEMRRTALLAQLAFASGLTAAGGKSWEKVGKGFSDAAGVYGKGFDRYQNALQDSADRYQKVQIQRQARDDAVKEASVKLYSDELSRSRERADKLMSTIDKMYSEELTAASKNELEMDPAAIADIQRRRAMSQSLGVYIPRRDPEQDDVRKR